MTNLNDIEKKIRELRRLITEHQKNYYSGHPIISDPEFDALFDELLALEKAFPQFYDPNSPTSRVGSDLDTSLEEKPHKISVLSLDKCYSINELNTYLQRTAQKTGQSFQIMIEPKIDGISLVLYYERGELEYALTRGNGYSGNDVTMNVRTVGSIPLYINYKQPLVVRGELYILKTDFQMIQQQNPDMEYANPRNLAAGIIRRKNSRDAARFPLKFFAYEGHFNEELFSTHEQILKKLNLLKFPVNSQIQLFKMEDTVSIKKWVSEAVETRNELPYEIDGLVVKINELSFHAELGDTDHHPRWAIAYKFEAPMASTILRDVIFQVGRGGRITPVAILEPVLIAGSTITRATLHNEDYLSALELSLNDRVAVSKRGDVIPAIEEVLDHNSTLFHPVVFPSQCPSCAHLLIKDGAHHFCMNSACQARKLGQLIFFASKDMIDLQRLGEKTIEFLFDRGFISDVTDFYFFDYNRLLEFEGFKEKKIQNIQEAIEKSKSKPFSTLLAALGLKDLGPKVIERLFQNGYHSLKNLQLAAQQNDPSIFLTIDGIGDKLAQRIVHIFSDPKTIQLLQKFKSIGFNLEESQPLGSPKQGPFSGQTWVITGTFDRFQPREKAATEIIQRGGKITSSVTGKTTHLLAGKNPGSKYDKALTLKKIIVSETDFTDMLAHANSALSPTDPQYQLSFFESDNKGNESP